MRTLGAAQFRDHKPHRADQRAPRLPQFEKGVPKVGRDETDPQESAFVQRATRFYQIYDGETGALLRSRTASAARDVHAGGSEVVPRRAAPSTSRPTTADPPHQQRHHGEAGETYLLQVGTSLAAIDSARDVPQLLWGVPVGLLVAVLAGRSMAAVARSAAHEVRGAARTID
jgi:hypothetical protein